MKRRIAAAVVLYRMQPAQSVTYQTLLGARGAVPGEALELEIFLHDNSPAAVPPAGLPAGVRYFADGANSGLAGAYNRVLAAALAEGYEWLLTLDQDTALPEDAFTHYLEGIAAAEAQPEIAAVVPAMLAGGRRVSPHTFAAGAWPRQVQPGYTGVVEQEVFAFNSGALLRVAALRQLGGYSPLFPLDMSDLFLFAQLSRFGKRVYLLGGLVLGHDLSLLNMGERMSAERYRAMLAAESAFWDLHRNGLAGLERTLRLLGRMPKHLRQAHDAELRRLTLRQLGRRLFLTRRQRLRRWRAAMAPMPDADPLPPAANPPLLAADPPLPAANSFLPAGDPLRPAQRPMVSVCMAAYNGERYLEAQLRTIAGQLGPGDEIVAIDDRSTDRTLELLEVWQQRLAADPAAPRMVLVRHAVNRGAIRTFEQALRSATGDILFLADDDDLWAPGKVRKVLEVFAAEPAVQLVSTGVALIDEHGEPLTGSDLLKHRRFTARFWANIWHNQFQGSAMAFRAALLREILPLPAGRLFLHDSWIGTRNTVTGGRAAHIDEPLLLYRRHTANLSGRLSRGRQIRLRVELLLEHLRQLWPRR